MRNNNFSTYSIPCLLMAKTRVKHNLLYSVHIRINHEHTVDPGGERANSHHKTRKRGRLISEKQQNKELCNTSSRVQASTASFIRISQLLPGYAAIIRQSNGAWRSPRRDSLKSVKQSSRHENDCTVVPKGFDGGLYLSEEMQEVLTGIATPFGRAATDSWRQNQYSFHRRSLCVNHGFRQPTCHFPPTRVNQQNRI